MSEIKNLNPVCIWKNFYALTQVPRPSGHLEKIQQFLLDFAKQAGVEAFKDPADNIVMRKPASPGMEKKKGVILQAHMDMVPQKTPESSHNFETDPEDAAVKVVVSGLRGGHSGLEINEGRANSNKLMVQIVRDGIAELDARLASWHGGNMRNAIPFKTEAVLTLPKENVAAMKELAEDWKETFNEEFKLIEPQGIEITCEDAELPKMELPEEIQDNIVNAIFACHDGVVRFIPAYPSVVETSSNLAIIDIQDGKATLKILARSSREDMKAYVVGMLQSCFSMAGMKVETAGSYGGWDPNPDSEILHLLLKEYKDLFGEDGIIQVDHAGLECSVILGKYPWLDVVSFGPTMKSPHTTSERALIKTVEPFWQLLKKTLEDVPVK